VDKDWDEVIDKAKAENKFLFVDVYADWCSPCKKMDAEVFPDSTLGAYMNKNFVSYKANYKTPTGNMLAKRHGVGSFPTYLFLDVNGNLIYRSRGFMSAEKLIEEAQVAADPGSFNRYKLYKKKFNAGNRDQELLRDYLLVGYKRYKKPDVEVFNAYYKTLDLMDKQDRKVMETVAMMAPYSDHPSYDLGLTYLDQLPGNDENYDKIVSNLNEAIDRTLMKNCKEAPGAGLTKLMDQRAELLSITNPRDTAENVKKVALTKVRYHSQGEHWDTYATEAHNFVQSYIFSDLRFHQDSTTNKSMAALERDMKDAELLAEFADNVQEYVQDPDAFEVAHKWIDKAIDWNNKYEYHAIKAYLHLRQDDLNEAVNVARRALEKARKAKDDYADDLQNVLMDLVDGNKKKQNQ
jgi:thiol-disulfide isomerase/thioredoxin